MRKKLGTLIFLITMFIAYNFFFKQDMIVLNDTKNGVIKKEKKSYQFLLNEKIQQKDRPKQVKIDPVEWAQPYPKSCEKTFQIFLDRDLQDIKENFLDYEQDIRNEQCFDDLAQINSTMELLWSYRCELNDLESYVSKEVDHTQCPLNLKFIKALVVSMLYQDDHAYSSLPSQILLSKLLFVFVDVAMEETSGTDLTEQKVHLMDELIVRHPDLLIAHKAKFLIHFLDSANSGIYDQNLFDDLLYQLSLFNNDDHYKLYSLALASVQYSDASEELLNWLNSFVNKYPNYSMGWYIRSRYYWEQENRQNAIQDLNIALSLDPNNSNYQLTRNKIQMASFSESIYEATINLSLSDFLIEL